MTVTLSGVTLRGVQLHDWNPSRLFAGSEKGVWYDPSDLSTVYADVAGTTLASVDGPVGKILDKSGNGKHATAAADNTTRPTLRYSGGLYYLEFDGSNDALSTASIDFTATDKMTVWVGVRKFPNGMVCELSANASSNNGSFYVYASGDSWNFQLRGTAETYFVTQSYLSPISNVLSCQCDISQSTRNDELKPRINGALNQVGGGGSADAGSGNFGNYPLYIGARGGSSFWFNGRLYSLIVRGAATSTADIVNTETWVNRKTGAY